MTLYVHVAGREHSQLLREAASACGLSVVFCASLGELGEFVRLHAREKDAWQGGVMLEYVSSGDLTQAEEIAAAAESALPIYILFRPSNSPSAAAASPDMHFFQFPDSLDAAVYLLRSLSLSTRLTNELASRTALSAQLRHGRSPNFTSPLSPAELVQFLDREWKRCFRYDWPISAIVVTAADNALPSTLKAALVECLRRPGDGAGDWPGDGRPEYVAILSETDRSGAEHVRDRMLAALQQWRADHPDHPPARIEMATATLRPLELYRKRSPLAGGGDLADTLIRAAAAGLASPSDSGRR